MAYDPQARHRRPQPAEDDPVPVDSLLGEAPPAAEQDTAAQDPVGAPDDDPPPDPAVTPAPADPPSDRLLIGSGIFSVVGALTAALLLRRLWKHWRRPRPEGC